MDELRASGVPDNDQQEKMKRMFNLNELKENSKKFLARSLSKGRKSNKLSRSVNAKEISTQEEDWRIRIDEYQFKIFDSVRLNAGLPNDVIIKSFNPEMNHRIFKS